MARFPAMRTPTSLPVRPRTRAERGSIGAWLLGVTVVIVAVVFAGWWFLVRSDAAAKPKIENTKVSAGGSVDGDWKVTANDAKGSFVGYRVHEKFAQGLVDNEATGRTTDVTASMTVAGTTVSDVKVSANLATLKSDEDFRDQRLHSQGLETDKFPTATFAATGPVTLPSAPAKGTTVKVDVPGDLTLHGVTKKVTIPLQGRWDGTTIQVVGSLPITMSDYGITPPTSPIIAEVDDHGTLELQLFFVQ
jgi:polyisoprenoid-binding protein YceI